MAASFTDYGYDGVGFQGGYWRGREFYYNRNVTNINVTVIHNTYVKNVVVHNNTHVSYNGGRGGISARPTRQQEVAAHEQHRDPTPVQSSHREAAAKNREFLASVNHGQPAVAATPKPESSAERAWLRREA